MAKKENAKGVLFRVDPKCTDINELGSYSWREESGLIKEHLPSSAYKVLTLFIQWSSHSSLSEIERFIAVVMS